MRKLVILGVLGLSLVGVARADWPQFGGPERNFTSEETGLVDSFDSSPKVLWQVDASAGYSGAAIYDGKVFFLDRVDDQRDVLKVYDLTSGRELWSCGAHDPGDTGKFPGQRSTPSVTDQYVLAVGARGGVY
jgi:outer membrane protein assembly factor BamB